MNRPLLVAFTFSVFIISCGDTRSKKDVQEILGEEKTEVKINRDDLISSSAYDRRYQDIIESLFTEELKNDETLRALFADINAIENLAGDSTKNTNKYLDLNYRYFRAAEERVYLIKDSALKKKVVDIFQKEKSKFNASVGPHKKYLDEIKDRNLILEDRKNLLKLFITLPLIKKYQDEKLPDLEQLKNIKKDIEFLIKESEKIVEIK